MSGGQTAKNEKLVQIEHYNNTNIIGQ